MFLVLVIHRVEVDATNSMQAFDDDIHDILACFRQWPELETHAGPTAIDAQRCDERSKRDEEDE